jgi:segregation and condensation protein B
MKENLAGAIEALLFVYGEPMELKRISKLLKIGEQETNNALDDLKKNLEQENRGLTLIFSDDKVQLATKPDFAGLLENFIKEEFKENLTPASLETLSLIAYFGPLSRAQIDYYRGVNSGFILRNLLIRGLVERFPAPQKGNAYLYRPSFDLLKYLGISNVRELPEYDKYREIKL